MAVPSQRAAALEQIRLLRRFAPAKPRRRKPPRQQQPDTIRLEYLKAIRVYLEQARAMLERELFPYLPGMLAEAAAARGDSARMDRETGRRVNEIMDRLAAQFFGRLGQRELEDVAERFGRRTSDFQRDQLHRQVRAAVGVDVFLHEPRLLDQLAGFTAENVALIKSIPNAYLDDVEKRVTSAMRQGLRWESLAPQLAERYGVSESKAALIARDQVGKFFGELNQARQENLGVRSYVWQTSNDNRVRPEHEERQGESFKWSDPPEDGPPGQAINCRCWADPDLSELLAGL